MTQDSNRWFDRDEDQISWKHFLEALPWVFILVVVSLGWVIFLNPIIAIFRRKTERYRALVALRVDALCDEIASGEDFGLREDACATERELERIAYHLSERCSLGAVDDARYAVGLTNIFSMKYFWASRNGWTARQRQNGIAIGFWLGVAVSGAAAGLVQVL